MKHSKLADHKFKKGKFVTPWNEAMGSIGKFESWCLERLPEYIWIGLIIKKYGREVGLKKCYFIIKKLQGINPNITVPTITNIILMNVEKQSIFYKTVQDEVGISTLAPLTILYTYSSYPVFFETFFESGSYDEKLSKIIEVLEEGFDHQSHFSTDIRFLGLYFGLLHGKINMPEDTLNMILEYPKLNHSDSKMRMIRPLIRSSEMMLINIEPINKSHLSMFWEGISEMSDCRNFYIDYKSNAVKPETYIDYLNEIFHYLAEIFVTTEPLNDKILVLLGLATFSYKRIAELVDHNLYNAISGRSTIRNLIENYIMMKYLLLHEKDHDNIWNDYQYYGIGLYKLVMARARENCNTRDESHVNYRYLELLVNEYMDEEYIDMDTSYFDKQNIRIKAKEVGEEDLYGLYYDYDSSFEHGLWGAIRESALLKCNTPTHKYHCVPDVDNNQKLPCVWKDSVFVMNKILILINSIINIPDELLEEVKGFE